MSSEPRKFVTARALIVEGDKLLLCNERGLFWGLPGGRSEHDESLTDAVKREVYEETGLTVDVGNIHAVSEFFRTETNTHFVNVIFHCRVTDGKIKKDWEDVGGVTECCFFDHDEILKLEKVVPDFVRDGEWCKDVPSVRHKGFEK